MRDVSSALYLVSLSMVAAVPAAAQVSVPTTPPSMEDQTGVDATSGLEDIIVTAQRRSERQQDVPISITTVTAATAAKQGVGGTESLGIAVPSLQFSRQGANGGVPFLRGVGAASATVGFESPVAVYVDDVYVSASAATLLQFNNIDNVEVLKGPQGTLFGRNATGGVVSIHTLRPSHTTRVDATVGGGSYGTYFGNLYATGGLTDNVAINIAATGQNQTKGYGRSLITGRDTLKSKNFGVRGQLLFEPDDATSLLISGDYSKSKSDAGLSAVLLDGAIGLGGGTRVDPFGTYDFPADFGRSTVYGVSAKLTHDFTPFSVTSITAARHTRNDIQLDTDASPTGLNLLGIRNTQITKTFSQEIQILSPQSGAKFNWIVGGFYYRANAGYDPYIIRGTTQTAVSGARIAVSNQIVSSLAGFGEVNYEFLPDTKATIGLRYNSDNLDFTANEVNGVGVLRGSGSADANSSKLTYRAVLDHKFGRDLLLYGSVSRGFKTGAFQTSNPFVISASGARILPPVEPEVLDAYEVGFKSELFDRQVRLNLAAFHYDYSNLQVTTIQNSSSTILNAAAAKMDGVDADFSFAPNRYVTINGGASYLNARYTEFPAGPLYVPAPGTCTPVPRSTGAPTGGSITCFVDLKGNSTPRSPKFTASIAATFTLPTEKGDFSLSPSLYHNSGFTWEPDNRRRQPRYDLVGLQVAWLSPDKRFEVRLYVRNLLNEYYYSYLTESSQRDAGTPDMPRNGGGSVTVHF